MNTHGSLIVKRLHQGLIMNRRIHAIASGIEKLIPRNAAILDIGAGSGEIAEAILSKRPDISIAGIDIKNRENTKIEIKEFNGKDIEYEDDRFDYSIIVDVLHHTYNKKELLREAIRVSKKGIIVKDHLYKNKFDYFTLSFMDYIGNKPYSIDVIYDYFTLAQWQKLFSEEKININSLSTDLKLYPFPFNLVFDRQLHVLFKLDIN